ncbi:hypothetical protein GCM10010145_62360 [Streptomyces ruber]|uniref:STAS domain-containing protein n=2 Tax=Streptomyces TaxID=1883 RepID=A0A918BRJ3_9ACTN|nr:hypothetical protein [Streptomyces ruber]GGQ84240.1 hypothetical protein GCM10010145_62360 [Streptomyces ruber]
MSDHFIDDLMFITPLGHAPGIRLFGQITAAHKSPVTLALLHCQGQHQDTTDVTVDLTGVQYLSQDALKALLDVARALPPPLRLTLRARPELGLPQRLTTHGWHESDNLRVNEA